ncbi:hypothetical protein PLICRDRAFT_545717 [Plicaturopsis crispa FD-325 SS-3]|nr:hypothetical protein PLICRDRAFT_545717 [Plicaturopsis crispa FD-325 SS-3]
MRVEDEAMGDGGRDELSKRRAQRRWRDTCMSTSPTVYYSVRTLLDLTAACFSTSPTLLTSPVLALPLLVLILFIVSKPYS